MILIASLSVVTIVWWQRGAAVAPGAAVRRPQDRDRHSLLSVSAWDRRVDSTGGLIGRCRSRPPGRWCW
jgi:hypothetical protein